MKDKNTNTLLKTTVMERNDEYLNEKINKHLSELDQYTNFNKNSKIDYLYHYTDINGCLGILNNKTLWASNAFFLNDSSEINYGLELSYPLFKSFYSSLKSERAKEILKEFNDDFPEFVLSSNLFLISFCEDGDLLSQWRGYSQNNDGVSIRFNLPILRTFPKVNLLKVVYDENIQINILNHLFELLNELIEYLEKGKNISFLPYFTLWISIFTTMILTLKDCSFSEEKEWRIIYNHDAAGNNKNIEYRIRNNYILPYIQIDKLNLIDLVNEITIGPSSSFNIIIKSINYFLYMNNYHFIGINQSKIPYRK